MGPSEGGLNLGMRSALVARLLCYFLHDVSSFIRLVLLIGGARQLLIWCGGRLCNMVRIHVTFFLI